MNSLDLFSVRALMQVLQQIHSTLPNKVFTVSKGDFIAEGP